MKDRDTIVILGVGGAVAVAVYYFTKPASVAAASRSTLPSQTIKSNPAQNPVTAVSNLVGSLLKALSGQQQQQKPQSGSGMSMGGGGSSGGGSGGFAAVQRTAPSGWDCPVLKCPNAVFAGDVQANTDLIDNFDLLMLEGPNGNPAAGDPSLTNYGDPFGDAAFVGDMQANSNFIDGSCLLFLGGNPAAGESLTDYANPFGSSQDSGYAQTPAEVLAYADQNPSWQPGCPCPCPNQGLADYSTQNPDWVPGGCCCNGGGCVDSGNFYYC